MSDGMMWHQQPDAFLAGMSRTKRGMPGEETLRGIEDKANQSSATFARLKQRLADRPDLHPQMQDLEQKFNQRSQLLGKLRYSMEFRHELKRMGMTTEKVRGLIPSRDTPHGHPPTFVIGVTDQEGQQHLFMRPIRVQR